MSFVFCIELLPTCEESFGDFEVYVMRLTLVVKSANESDLGLYTCVAREFDIVGCPGQIFDSRSVSVSTGEQC